MHYLSNAILFGSVMALIGSLTCQAAEPDAVPAAPAVPVGQQGAEQIPASGRPLVLEVGKGTLLRLARAASTVFVADPAIADVQVKSPMRVTHDLSRLRQAIAELVTGQDVRVRSVGPNIVLSGLVASAGEAERLQTLALEIKDAIKGTEIIDRVRVATPNEVNLRVRIAEVDRNVLKEFGINWQKIGTTLQFQTHNPTITNGIVPSSIIFGRLGGQAVSAELDALAQEGFVTDLAEPNLTAMSGQTARFLAGGEFPVPIVQGGAVGTAPTVTIAFKQFGVSLAFTPTVIDASHLNLRVQPEVSQLDYANAVTNNGFLIPALTVRRADTTVELGSGESFALAGLLQNTSAQTITKVPWLGDIPILGALFRSNQFQHNESELVVIVTPYLVNPVATRLADPLEGFALPHDVQRVLNGSTYRQELPAPPRGPLGAGGKGLIGPAGFQLD